jgi:uroporphyrinogen-III synthase
MSEQSLKNVSLWITRPHGQADQLSTMLQKRGAKVLHLPMIEIEKIAISKKARASIKKLKNYDLVFFISTNAANLGMELIDEEFSRLPDKPAYFAPGPTTAKVLESYGLKASYPDKAMSTEALSILPEIRSILENKNKKKKALIFRGQGGRELLANTLRAKGVEVEYIELYKRTLPSFSEAYLKELSTAKKPDGIIFSSAEAIQNFIALFEKVYPEYKSIPVFLSSERLMGIARDAGFANTVLLKAANDQSVVDGVEKAHG